MASWKSLLWTFSESQNECLQGQEKGFGSEKRENGVREKTFRVRKKGAGSKGKDGSGRKKGYALSLR